MDEELFDEFGNLIDLNTNLESHSAPAQTSHSDKEHDEEMQEEEEQNSQALIKQRDNIDLADVDILVETDNTQSLGEPLIKPKEAQHNANQYINSMMKSKKVLPQVTYDREYMLRMCSVPERIRNVAFVGPTNSGKTSLVDLIVMNSHSINSLIGVNDSVKQGWKHLKFMDSFKQELERGMSIKLNGMTLLATDLNDKSMVLNLIDTPGHVNFMDEVAIALNACNNVIICVDVVEGMTAVVEQLIKQSIKRNKAITFIFNKIDRLVLDLKLKPEDSYLKLLHIVVSINQYVDYLSRKLEKEATKFSPESNNVVFASSKLGFTFTLEEFVQRHYKEKIPRDEDRLDFIEMLWDKEYFIEFILDPIYKVITHTLTYNDPVKLVKKLTSLRILQKKTKIPKQLQDPQPILRFVMQNFMGREQLGLYTAIQNMSPPSDLVEYKDMVGHILKIMDYCGEEYCLVKVHSNELKTSSTFKILNEDKDENDEIHEFNVDEIMLMDGQYCIPVETAYSGQIVLIKSNLKGIIVKCGTIYNGKKEEIPDSLRLLELDYINKSYFKIIIAPLQPRELPKLIAALDKINKYYPGVVIRVEESGEHVVLGTGELYMDCLLYDLREVYGKMEIKVSSPMTVFTESCEGESFAAIPVETMDSKIKLSVGASRMDLPVVKDITHGELALGTDSKQLSRILRSKYGWDSLMARNVWSFHGTNVLIDDTLPDETNKDGLKQCQDMIKQGFYWAVKEGPLCGEPMFGVQFKLLEFENISEKGTDINMSQLIPIMRKACYIALLTANPVLLEPVYEVSIVTRKEYMEIVSQLFGKRRGGIIINSKQIVGSPFVEIRAHLPIIESVGFEIDLRLVTKGQAICQLQYVNEIWKRVPGNVMDQDVAIPKLKPATRDAMARDFIMKTRRRRGEQEPPTLAKYLEPELYEELVQSGLI